MTVLKLATNLGMLTPGVAVVPVLKQQQGVGQ